MNRDGLMSGDPVESADSASDEFGGRRRRAAGVYAAAVISWLGFLVHNVADLPGQTLLSPETLWPSVVTAALLVVYAAGLRRVAAIGLLIWAALNLVGGVLSVLPLPVLPFEPEQSLRHYSFHVLYAATQIPLIVVSVRLAREQLRPGLPKQG